MKILAVTCLTLLTLGCGREDPSGSPSTATREDAEVSRRYVGCIAPTADPSAFVLTTAEGRDFTTGEPGTPLPQKSELPEGAPPPDRPTTATAGTPGGGPTPTTTLVTYRLRGDAGTDLSQLVGHTVEVVGRSVDAGELMADLYVTSVRDLADHCK